MNSFSLKDIASALNADHHGEDVCFRSISTDTRTVQSGDCFVALSGPHYDGHDYLAEAKSKGAIAAIVSQASDVNLPILRVKDTRQALGQLAHLCVQDFAIPRIGITGSCGKTTTKSLLAHILSLQGMTLASEASFNNEIGVPLTLLRLTNQHQYAVIEMGANHPGEIAYVTGIAQPTIAILLNAAAVHLEGFIDVDGVAKAKGEIFQGLGRDGIAIINADDTYAEYWRSLNQDHDIMTFGLQDQADVWASNIHVSEQGFVAFDCHLAGQHISIQLALLGQHNVYNALAAATAALALEVPIATIKQGLETFDPVGKRLNIKTGDKGTLLIDDTYNANPFSVKAALAVLTQYPRKKIFVLGDMGELGEQAEQFHQDIGHHAKALGIDGFYAFGPLSRQAAKAFGSPACAFDDKKSLNEALTHELGPDVVIMAKGSKVQKMWEVIAALQNNKDK